MRSDFEHASAEIIPFPLRNRFTVDTATAPIVAGQDERFRPVCAAAFDSWYHAAAIAEEHGLSPL